MRKLIPFGLTGLALLGASGCGDERGARGEPRRRALLTQTITQDGKPVGRLDGTVTITAIVGGLEHRVGTVQYTLPGGAIVASGVYIARPRVFIPARGVTRAIVGGTGKYKGATGEVTQTPTPDGEIESVIKYTTDG